MFQPAMRHGSASCVQCPQRSERAFCHLSPSAWADFAHLGTVVHLQHGELLFQEDEPSDHVFILCSGQLKLFCVSREGRVRIVRIAAPGDVLGLGAVAAGMRYELSAKALVPTQVKVLKRREMLAFLERNAEAGMHAVRSLSQEYKSAFFDARRLALMPSAYGRLGSVLLELARGGSDGRVDARFTMALTHEDLAGLSGLTRETVTRLLAKMQASNLLRIRGSSMTILDPARLVEPT